MLQGKGLECNERDHRKLQLAKNTHVCTHTRTHLCHNAVDCWDLLARTHGEKREQEYQLPVMYNIDV